MSCHQSELSHVQYTQLDDNCHNLIAKASTCSSNISQTSIPPGVRGVNVPCYGSIPRALAEMMTDDMFANGFRRLGVERPSYRLDTFAQKKMERVIHMCDIATTTLNIQETDKDAFARVKSFAEKFAELDPWKVSTDSEWKQWVGQHVPDNYEDNLSFDRLLSNFGVDDAIAAQVRAYEIREIKDGKEETNTLEQASLRWLGKALVGFSPQGRFTDLVNLIFAMKDIEPGLDMSERHIVHVIRDFHQEIKRLADGERFLFGWMPEVLMHDADYDDMLCWILLDFIRDTLKLVPLEVHVQLPVSDEFDGVVTGWKQRDSVTVFKDATISVNRWLQELWLMTLANRHSTLTCARATLEEGHTFLFVRASSLKSSVGPFPKFQDLKQDWIVKMNVSIHNVRDVPKLSRSAVAVSHVWQTPHHPDPKGEQANIIRWFLCWHPEIDLVWIDWCCLPQGTNKTKAEHTYFEQSLKMVNLVFLAFGVIIVLDTQFLGRFWPQLEAFLSYQQVGGSGLHPLPASVSRTTILCTGLAAESPSDFTRILESRWRQVSVADAISKLEKNDVVVTNEKDKEIQLQKLKNLQDNLAQIL